MEHYYKVDLSRRYSSTILCVRATSEEEALQKACDVLDVVGDTDYIKVDILCEEVEIMTWQLPVSMY